MGRNFDIPRDSTEVIRKIAELKLEDLNCVTVESAINQVLGTAKSMGVEVIG